MRRLLLVLILNLAATAALPAQILLGTRVRMDFATISEGKEVLTARDDFVQLLSPFDRAARTGARDGISEEDFLDFVGSHVLAWTEPERRKVTAACKGIQDELAGLGLPFPDRILLVKTSGEEEGGAAYTRARAIVLPKTFLSAPEEQIKRTVCHELFHVLTRANPDLRTRLYGIIGFTPCGEVPLPVDLGKRKITNPDAPRNDFSIRLTVAEADHWAVPILFSNTEEIDPARKKGVFSYLQFRFLLVERSADGTSAKPLVSDGKPRLATMKEVSGFHEQIGRNTGYTIHPEEILAENFVLLVLRRKDLPNPEIIRKMRGLLDAAATGGGPGN